MKMKKKFTMVAAVLFVAVVSSSAFASHWGRGPGNEAGPRGMGPCQADTFKGMPQLSLTAEQTAKLAEIRNVRTKEMMPIQEQMFAKRNAIKALWLDKEPNQEKIVAAQKELGALRAQMVEKITASRIASLQVLTQAQQEIAKARYASGRHGAVRGGMTPPAHARGGMNPPAMGRGGQFNFGPGCLK
jgi:Spy/CpxP family protein refolding chaperone